MSKKFVIVVDEAAMRDILTQGIPHKLLFNETEWEGQDLHGILRGAVIISNFPNAMFIRDINGKAWKIRKTAWQETVSFQPARREQFDAR